MFKEGDGAEAISADLNRHCRQPSSSSLRSALAEVPVPPLADAYSQGVRERDEALPLPSALRPLPSVVAGGESRRR